MKIRTGDIYLVEMAKYTWANQFTIGKVLDITCGKYLNYAASKLLLENNTDEVWSFDLLDIQEYVTLRKLDHKKISYQIKNKKEIDSVKFDTILAFNILSVTDNVNEILKFIFNHLNSNGTAILSIVNDDRLPDNNHDLITKDLNLFSKNNFEQTLKSYFNYLEFFSQGTVTYDEKKENIKQKLKIKIRNFFLKSINRYNFYFKYLRFLDIFFTNLARNKENKKTHRYEIIPFYEKNKPLFSIAKCKK